MKNVLILSIFLALSLHSYAQHWEEVDGGIHGVFEDIGTDVYCILADSVHHLLYVAGDFDSAGDLQSRNLAFWNGSRWISSEDQMGNGGYTLNLVTLGLYQDTLYEASEGGVGQWIDTIWLKRPIPQLAGIQSFCIYHDSLYAVTNVGVYKYTGTSWDAIGILEYDEQPTEGHALAVYQDQLVVGGLFRGVGKLHCNNIASWDGNKWHTLSTGTEWSESKYLGTVRALSTYQGDLYAAGLFDTAGGIYCPSIARWNGVTWDSLGSRDTGYCGDAFCMLTHDSLLYIGGNFVSRGGGCVGNKIVTWDGSKWKDLNLDVNLDIYTMTFFDNQLYAAGHFSILNDTVVHNIVRLVNPAQPVCTSPYKGKAEDISATSATLQWKDSSTSPTGYRIYYKVKNTTGWQKAHSPTTSKTLKGLTAGITYSWMVGTKCDTAHSGFSKRYEFTTLTEKQFAEVNSKFDFSISPNPNNGQFNLSTTSTTNAAIIIKVFDVAGRIVYADRWLNAEGSNTKTLDLTKLTSGVYSMQLIGNNNMLTKKLVLMR